MDIEAFTRTLETELHRRYEACEDFAATPSSILLAVLNAVAEARIAAMVAQPGTDEGESE